MGDFIGAAGGILMIVLIVVLLWRFLLDVGVVKDKTCARSIGLFTVAAVGIGMMQVLLGALIANFNAGPISAFDFVNVWTFEPVSGMLADNSPYTLDMLGSKGIFPLYPVLVSVFSRLLFDMYAECAFYISFLSGVVFYTCMGMYFRKQFEEEQSDKMIAMLFCFPGMFLLFLPCSFALFMASFAATLLALESRHKAVAAVLVLLCCLTHVCGIAAIALLAYRLIAGDEYKHGDTTKMFIIICVQLVLLGVGIRLGWGNGAERWLIFGIPAVTLAGRTKLFKRDEVCKLVLVMEVLLCGVYMVGKLYNEF